MQPIADLSLVEKQLFEEVKGFLKSLRTSIREYPENLTKGIKILESVRERTYENLNQIQHEAMILRAARQLQQNDFAGQDVEWYWNPRQTGGKEEPDLRGALAGHTLVSAEITTSAKPNGVIDSRIRATLEKLSNMAGKRVFFVLTEAMYRRASTKIEKAGYQVEVRRI